MELDKSPIHLIHNTNNPFFLEPSPCHLLKVNVSEHSIKTFWNSYTYDIGFNSIALQSSHCITYCPIKFHITETDNLASHHSLFQRFNNHSFTDGSCCVHFKTHALDCRLYYICGIKLNCFHIYSF